MENYVKKNELRYGGFSLLEIMIVIAIIGILATIIITSLSSLKGNARDARRISDVRNLAMAIELYNAEVGQNPSCGAYGGCDYSLEGGLSPLDSSKDGIFMSFLSPYYGGKMPPIDPINDDQYFYLYGVGEFPHGSGLQYYYAIAACLENPKHFNLPNANSLDCPVGNALCEQFKNNCFIISKRYP